MWLLIALFILFIRDSLSHTDHLILSANSGIQVSFANIAFIASGVLCFATVLSIMWRLSIHCILPSHHNQLNIIFIHISLDVPSFNQRSNGNETKASSRTHSHFLARKSTVF
jgi:hypothetical protein